MIKSLKKTMSAVLSDISMEWLFPETEEVLLSPVGNTFLFPGDSLIGYSVVCDTTRYHTNPKSVSDVFTYSCLPARRRVNQVNAELSTGQEEEVQHDALHRVGQLRFLSLSRGGRAEDGRRHLGLQRRPRRPTV